MKTKTKIPKTQAAVKTQLSLRLYESLIQDGEQSLDDLALRVKASPDKIKPLLDAMVAEDEVYPPGDDNYDRYAVNIDGTYIDCIRAVVQQCDPWEFQDELGRVASYIGDLAQRD